MNHIKEKEAQEAEAFNLKNKRDQYVYEIRKQKVDNKIREKRVKLTQAFLTPQNQQANGPNQDQPLEQIEKGNQSFQELTQEFFRGVGQNDITIVFNAIQNMRHKLSRNDSPPLGEFIETGIFPKLVKLLAEEYKEYVDLQFEVIWVITNAVTGTPEQTAKIIDKETIEILMRYLWHTNSQLVDQVFWALGNLSGDSDDIRRILLDLGIVDKIYGFMKSNKRYSENLVKSVSWIISNLALMRQAHDRLYSLLPLVENFLCQSDDEVCSYACWTYSNLTNIQNDKIFDAFMTPKFLKRITELLESPDLDIKRPVIRTVGNILSGKSSQTKKMFEAGCLEKLEALIEHRKPIVRKEVIWAISNILAESQYIIEKVLEGGLFAKLLSTIILDVTPIKVEALICFVNALSIANMDQAESIIRMGLLKILSQVLASHVPEVVLAGLEVLDAVLIHGKKVQDAEGAAGNPILLSLDHEGVIRFIEELQTHQSNEVYAKVTQIIDAHFETQDVDQA